MEIEPATKDTKKWSMCHKENQRLNLLKGLKKKMKEAQCVEPAFLKEYQNSKRSGLSRDYHYKWATYTLKNHRKKGIKVYIGPEELAKLVRNIQTCTLCGYKLKWNTGKIGKFSPTLDRINNQDFINKDNIQVICLRCNSLKGSDTMEEFIRYCSSIVVKSK